MHIYFVGIGGTAIGPLALIAHQAGYRVSGSDKRGSQYIDYLKKHGVSDITIGNNKADIEARHAAEKIDWVVHTSAVDFENPNHEQLAWAKQMNIRISKRDELLTEIIDQKNLKLIAIAGTHGKTTTTAMLIWLMKQLNIPISYSVGAKITFGDMGQYDPSSEYFIYECDEFDRNFLNFHPYLSLITGVDYDHHEIYKTRQDYQDAFQQFLDQSQQNLVWQSDLDFNNFKLQPHDKILQDNNELLNALSNIGEVNRRNAYQVLLAASTLTGNEISSMKSHIEAFPGLSRRFEKISDGLYTDYAHTIPKIAGCLQLAKEVSDNVVVVYEPLTNRRQHYVLDEYRHLFDGVKRLYWVPSYLAREDPQQKVLSPEELITHMANPGIAQAAELNDQLKKKIESHIKNGDTVVCMSGGGGASLDEWLRAEFGSH